MQGDYKNAGGVVAGIRLAPNLKSPVLPGAAACTISWEIPCLDRGTLDCKG